MAGGKIEDEQALAVNRSRGVGYLDAISSGDRCRAWQGAVTACDTRKNMLESTSTSTDGGGGGGHRGEHSSPATPCCHVDTDTSLRTLPSHCFLTFGFSTVWGEVTYAAHKGGHTYTKHILLYTSICIVYIYVSMVCVAW